MGTAAEMIGKTVRFYWKNKLVEGKIIKFKLPGFHVKVKGLKENPVIPAMAMKVCKVSSGEEEE